MSELDLDELAERMEGFDLDSPLSAQECNALISEARRARLLDGQLDLLRKFTNIADIVSAFQEAEAQRDELATTLAELKAHARSVLRCQNTGNLCGTDTWAVGHPCQCDACVLYCAKLDAPSHAIVPEVGK